LTTNKPTHLLAHLYFLTTLQAKQKNAKEPKTQKKNTKKVGETNSCVGYAFYELYHITEENKN